MALRRGLKTEANDIAREIRQELKLHSAAPLDPRKLAEHLEIPLLPLSAMTEVPQVVRYFTRRSTGEFSAVTVFEGPQRLIVYNDSHSHGRQSSDLAHELSHGLLLHEPHPALAASGCRDWDEDYEDQADWLGGALLISDEAAIAIVQKRLTLEAAAVTYGVSTKLVQWRLNVTGARKRVQRTRRYG